MCEPTTLAIMAVASVAMSLYEQQQQAKASERRAQQAQDSANQSFGIQAATENQRLMQDAALDSQSLQQVSRQAMEARATASVAAGESGVGGQSVTGLLNSFSREEAQFRNTTAQNAEFRSQQSSLRLQGADANRISRINDANSRVTSRPNFLGAALRLGEAGASTYFGAGGRINTSGVQTQANAPGGVS